MEIRLKAAVLTALATELGQQIEISEEEWQNAKTDALRDIYVNKLCFLNNVDTDYFINVMVKELAIVKRLTEKKSA
ncbi:MAG: hypothetical protein PWP27_170 [Clostridiales bacterium]|jgi:hypothetical protein|nr:hypothetical protein [Clostridiales bacterium]